SVKGTRFAHSMASSFDLTWKSQKPATRLCGSGNGPWVTVRFAPENLTRAPLELACSPSPASMTPALASSSLNLPISVSSFASGRTPASESLLPFTMTKNRILNLLFDFDVAVGKGFLPFQCCQIFLEAVDRAVPAVIVSVARLGGHEAGLVQRQLGLLAAIGEGDGDHRLFSRLSR